MTAFYTPSPEVKKAIQEKNPRKCITLLGLQRL